MGEHALNFWLPSVLKETGLSIGVVGLLLMPPYIVGVVAMIAVASSSDRRAERKWHMIGATACSGLVLIIMQVIGVSNNVFLTCFLALGIGVFYGRFGPFWTLPSKVLLPAVLG